MRITTDAGVVTIEVATDAAAVSADDLRELAAVVERVDSDENVRVVVFRGAADAFFLGRELPEGAGASADPRQPAPFTALAQRIGRAAYISVAELDGRVRGAGLELALACDLRLASEGAVLGMPDVGTGVVPSGGAIERLPRLVGPARALELLLGADDVDGRTASEWGLVNRAIPDAGLRAAVDALARRIASFDASPVRAVKWLVGGAAQLDDDAFAGSAALAAMSAAWPTTVERRRRLAATRERVGADEFERALPRYL